MADQGQRPRPRRPLTVRRARPGGRRLRGRRPLASGLLAFLVGLAGCGGDAERADAPRAPTEASPAPDTRAACAEHDPARRPFFGALHVHTALSFDAWSWEVRTGPDDAYAFARGGTVHLPPLDAQGRGTRPVRLERPLDFVAVTDHAEFLGPVALCTHPGSGAYDDARCRYYRGEGKRLSMRLYAWYMQLRGVVAPIDIDYAFRLFEFVPVIASETPEYPDDLCGDDGERCRAATASPWVQLQEAAERWYDRSPACAFTTFVAYEYSALPDYSNLHRNVIFRGARVPELPISYVEEPTPEGLWRALGETCLHAGTGCDVLAIPHNSNMSNGRMFRAQYAGATTTDEEAAVARTRAALEPLVEIYQHKGDSECRNGLSRVAGGPDEQCGFEKMRPADAPDCGDGTGTLGMRREGCISRRDFVRYALIEGLAEAERIGVNPFKLGIIAATDTHNGTGGAVAERGFAGQMGMGDASPSVRLQPGGIVQSPGGLAGVWAEENSRESLFAALRRRETFGTSGPRIVPRFFGGWDYARDLCGTPDLVARGYAGGVPMGGDLPPGPAAPAAPVFVVSALGDPGTPDAPGGRLERVQIVKGWVGDDGDLHQAVYDVAGAAEPGAGVDPATCTSTGRGHAALCGVWRDPAFDPARRAVYYARVLELPSCRWSAWECLGLTGAARPAVCDDPDVPRLIQERAWTSPIWYEPATS